MYMNYTVGLRNDTVLVFLDQLRVRIETVLVTSNQ